MLIFAWYKDVKRGSWLKGLVALALPAALWAQPPAVNGLPEDLLPGLRPILRTALDRSPGMISSSIALSQAEALRYGSDSGLWPNLGGSASYGVSSAATSSSGVSDSSTSSTGLNYSIGASQPVFQWGALKYRSEVGRIAVKIAEHQYADAYRLLAGTLRSQYLGLIYKHAGIRVAEDSRRIMAGRLTVAEAKLKEGTISPGEMLPPRMGFAEAQLAADKAIAEFAAGKRMFMRLAGLTELSDESIPFDVATPTYSPAETNQLLQAFLRDGPGMTIQGEVYLMTIKQADLNYRIAKTGLLPKFQLSASYGLTFQSSVNPSFVPDPANPGAFVRRDVITQIAQTNKSYGLYANWTLFDGFATRGAKLSALATRRLAERQLQTYADIAVDTVRSLREQVEFSARGLELAEQRRSVAKDGAARVAEDFKAGRASQSETDVANSNFLGADMQAIYVRIDFLKNWSEFVSQAGVDPVLATIPARYVRSTR